VVRDSSSFSSSNVLRIELGEKVDQARSIAASLTGRMLGSWHGERRQNWSVIRSAWFLITRIARRSYGDRLKFIEQEIQHLRDKTEREKKYAT
jgi:hypothetical protein